MPSTKKVVLLVENGATPLARVLETVLGNGYSVKTVLESKDPLPSFIVISTRVPDWQNRVLRLCQAHERVAVAFHQSDTTLEIIAEHYGAVVFLAGNSVGFIRNALREGKLIA